MQFHWIPAIQFSHFKKFSKGLLGLAAAFAVLSAGFESAFAQASKKSAPSVRTETLSTADGWNIPITYYESPAGEDAAVVILLHGENENQLVWQKNGMAARLQAENFAVITCDMRKHGNAKPQRDDPNKELTAIDYKAMASASNISELEVIQGFLFKEHQAKKLNMAKLAIVAAENMVPVVLNWAANDWTKKPYQDAPALAAMTPRGQTVRGLVLLSPKENVPGLSSAKPLLFFRTKFPGAVSFLFINGTKDSSARDVRTMYKQINIEKTGTVFKDSYPTALSGTDLLGRVPKSDALTLGFLKKQVQDLKIDWRDRRSRLER